MCFYIIRFVAVLFHYISNNAVLVLQTVPSSTSATGTSGWRGSPSTSSPAPWPWRSASTTSPSPPATGPSLGPTVRATPSSSYCSSTASTSSTTSSSTLVHLINNIIFEAVMWFNFNTSTSSPPPELFHLHSTIIRC